MKRTVLWLAGLALAATIAPMAITQDKPADEKKFGEFPQSWFWHNNDEQRARHEKLLNKPMPKLVLSEWMNKEIDLKKDLEGKVVVIDYWATWCPPCIASIPKNNKLAEKYEKDGLVFIGVCGSSRGQEKMSETAEQHKIAYPIAKDHTNESAKVWEVMWWPTYAVVDRAGKLRAIGLKPDHVEAVVQKLLKEEAPKKEEAKPVADATEKQR